MEAICVRSKKKGELNEENANALEEIQILSCQVMHKKLDETSRYR